MVSATLTQLPLLTTELLKVTGLGIVPEIYSGTIAKTPDIIAVLGITCQTIQ
ncbi:MAG: hypothetical protein IPN13_19175 [Bacteroidetes bacterium]|nr:hypothetical protein [Bacteroidota bacterium]